MENTEDLEFYSILLSDIFTEYRKYLLSSLINRVYDFNIMRKKIKDFNEHDNSLFDYNDSLTNEEIISRIRKAQTDLQTQYNEKLTD